MKVVIVGGVAGGATAAARLRRLTENTEIYILEKGSYVSFANCGLPYYIGGEIKSRDNLFLQTPESMSKRFNMGVRINNKVLGIDPTTKSLTVCNVLTGNIYSETYDKLILSPGSTPVLPEITGIELHNVFTVWNINDCDRVFGHMRDNSPKSAIVVGAGFLGLEMAENLTKQGISVTIVEAANQILPRLDYDMAAMVSAHIIENGVKLMFSENITTINYSGSAVAAGLKSGKSVTADMIIWCAGIRPNTDFLKSSGIYMNPKGGIVVNEYMETSVPDIYAVGDAVEITDLVSNRKTSMPLAGLANKQGRIAADNIMGLKRKFEGGLGTSIIKVFDLTVAFAGVNEKQLNDGKVDYIGAVSVANSHATYYPGSKRLFTKLLFNQSGQIYGAQIVGGDGVDKRMDVLATVMRLRGNVKNLTELELSYAPPFSSAKDPVNIAGYIAQNILENNLRLAYWDEIKGVDFNKTILLDVRDKDEWERTHIEGAIHIPLNSLRENIYSIPKDKEIITVCAGGQRAYYASRILVGNGFKNVRVLTGGMNFYNSVTGLAKSMSKN